MELAIITTIKNGYLQRAVDLLGSQSALARYLDVSVMTVSQWIRMRNVPVLTKPKWRKHWEEKLNTKLIDLIGVDIDEVFPAEFANKEFLLKEKSITQYYAVSNEQLEAGGFVPRQISAEQTVINREYCEIMDTALATLTPREEKVIRMRFGLDDTGSEHTHEEVGGHFRVTRERIRQIEAKALRKLRIPARSRLLKSFYKEGDGQ